MKKHVEIDSKTIQNVSKTNNFFTRQVSTIIFSDKTIFKHEFKIQNVKIKECWNVV
jgi:hypothetical protein